MNNHSKAMDENLNSLDQSINDDFIRFKENVKPLINLDLNFYKAKQMERRIIAFMGRFNYTHLDQFYAALTEDNILLDKFKRMLTINVSEFFRDSEQFKEIERVYLPELLTYNDKNIRIWSAGCAAGAEIYSIAMILDKLDLLQSSYLLATDFEEQVLENAQKGVFNQTEYETVPLEYQHYFMQTGVNEFTISEKLTSSIIFQKHNLLEDPFEKGFSLITCRNVVIYFTEEAKNLLYNKFYESLNNNGFFFVGSSERILNYKLFGFNIRSKFFYQKTL